MYAVSMCVVRMWEGGRLCASSVCVSCVCVCELCECEV